ncbi:hypothetical protein niasHT_021215 [Heterodera trifolii]|uniref:Uncharacterized protein n=1 Tax=Heterodera trifolii TaxID=157864 RepID=A0ABD2JWH0_9BILA
MDGHSILTYFNLILFQYPQLFSTVSSPRFSGAYFGARITLLTNIQLKSNNCGTADWQLNTFQRDPNGQWQLAKASKARIDGAGGEMEIKVDNSLQPRMFSRFKVACSNHLFCG